MGNLQKILERSSKAMLVVALVFIPLVRGIGYVMARELMTHHRNFLGVNYRGLYEVTQAVGVPNVAPVLLESIHFTGWFLLAITVVNLYAIIRLWVQDDGGSWLLLAFFTPAWAIGFFKMAQFINGPWQQVVAIVVIAYCCLAIELKRIAYTFCFR